MTDKEKVDILIKNMRYDINYYRKLLQTFHNSLVVDRIVVNGNATIVFWGDNTKTIVKKSDDDEYDLHHAFCAALAKKVYSHNSSVKKMIARLTVDQTYRGKKNKKRKERNTVGMKGDTNGKEKE